MINKRLEKYIIEEILPYYEKNDLGHNMEHIKYVIDRSIKFASTVPNINYDMVYAIACYHDIGHHIDPKNHEKISSEILLSDQKLTDFFTEEEIKIMAEAVNDHRASLETEPRNIYGKIISSADKNTSIEEPLKRTYAYRKNSNPHDSLEKIMNESRLHLIDKFGEAGYAPEKIYFPDEQYDKYLIDIRKLLADEKTFRDKYIQVNKIDQGITEVTPGKIYKHFKGNIIKILGFAYDTESTGKELQKLVIYKQLNNEKKTWARPYEMFFEKVDRQKYPEVVQEYRFEEYKDYSIPIKKELENYIATTKQEEQDKQNILDFLDLSDEQLNKFGHLTASAFIVNENLTKTLLVHQDVLGGFSYLETEVEKEEDFLSAIIKKVSTETGLEVSPLTDNNIFSIQILPIRGDLKGEEYISAHTHFDILYLLVAKNTDKNQVNLKTRDNRKKWFDLENLYNDEIASCIQPMNEKVVQKIKKITK